MARMGRNYKRKRETAPTFYVIPRKEKTFVTNISPGPHPKGMAYDPVTLLRDVLKLVYTRREALRVIKDGKLVIDGKPVGPVINTLAPLTKTSSNLLGPLDLGDKYYVIPPDRKFWVEGPSGAKMVVIGKIVKLIPGESFPADLLDRFNKQFSDYVTYKFGQKAFDTDEAWAADQEVTLVELTPRTIEEYTFDGYVGVVINNLSAGLEAGQVAIRFYLDGVPLDHLTSDPGHLGIDAYFLQHPPTTTKTMEPFTLARFPIKVIGDHTLKITAINVSGGSLTPPSGTNITVNIYAIVKYLMKG